MALRMMLVTLVVTLSLPIPDMGSCQFFMKELNYEIAGVFTILRNEIPISPTIKSPEISVKKTSPGQTNPPVPANPVAVVTSGKTAPKSIESPADLAFELIQEEFAREASEFSIQEAKSALARLSVKPVEYPLPPAPAAEEIRVLFSDLRRLEPAEVVRVVSLDSDWESICFSKMEVEDNLQDSVLLDQVASTNDLGHWSAIMAETCQSDDTCAVEEDFHANPLQNDDVIQTTEVASDSEWRAIISRGANPISFEQPDPDQLMGFAKPPVNEPNAVIKNAIRLTAEAIAAWSQLAAKAY